MLDLCAGAGGKTLALAALMQNTGQLYAYDADRHQLKPIFDRIKRAGVRNVQVLRAGDHFSRDKVCNIFLRFFSVCNMRSKNYIRQILKSA